MNRIVIAGAAGRMGQALVRCVASSTDLQLAGATEMPGHPALGQDAGLLAGSGKSNVPVTEDLAAVLREADTLIDFTFHAAVPKNLQLAGDLSKAAVVGTTGLSEEEEAVVKGAAKGIPVVWAPNMSLGVNLLFALTQRAAAILGLDYDIEIVEMHHRHKKDAPSGTALRLAEAAAEGRNQELRDVATYGRFGITGERERGQIGIHAIRGGDVVGDHTAIFATECERVELTHRASSRDTFARGALRAAAWVKGRKPGLYDMQDVLGFREG
jgi:4-hydroxy-tetrahydrodipicolinate reductase